MNMELLIYLIALICLCHHVGAKAFRENKGTFDHMHENLYLKKISDGGQGYDMRYIPHVDGKPIFIPFDETFHPPNVLKARPHSPSKIFSSTPKTALKHQNKANLEPGVKPLTKLNEKPKYVTPVLMPEYLKTKESETQQVQEEPDHPHVLDVVTRTVFDPNFSQDEQKPVSTHIKKKPIKIKPTEQSKIYFKEETFKTGDHSKKEPTGSLVKLHSDEVLKNKVTIPSGKKNGISVPLLNTKDYDSPLVKENLGKYDSEKLIVTTHKVADKPDAKLPEIKFGKPISFYPDKYNMGKLEYGLESEDLSVVSKKKLPAFVEQNYNQQDYDSPVVVEALVKKDYENLVKKPGMAYDSPIVVEALVKKTPIKDQTNEHKIKYDVRRPQYVHSVKHSDASDGGVVSDDGYDAPVVVRFQTNKKRNKYHTQIEHLKRSQENGQNHAEQGNMIDGSETSSAEQGIVDASTSSASVKQNFNNQDYDSPVIVRTLVKQNEENNKKGTGMTYDNPIVEALVKKTGQIKDPENKHIPPSDVGHQIVHSVKHSEASHGELEPDDGYDSPVVIRVDNKKDSKYHSEMQHSKNSQNGEIVPDDSYDSPVVIEVKNNKKDNKHHSEIQHSKSFQNGKIVPDDSYDSPVVIEVKNNKKDSKYQSEMKHSKGSPQNEQNSAEQENLIDSTEMSSAERSIFDDNFSIFSDDIDQLDVGSGIINERSSDISRFSNSNVWSLLTNFHSQERNKFKRCKTTNDEPGNCMPIQLCPTPNLQLTLDDLLKKMCAIDDVFIGICCPEFPAETLKVDWETFQNVSSNDQESPEMKFEECGIMSEESHSWPWMALLISISTRKIFCGGVLINPQYVLTAAHCTRKIPRNQIVVALGPIEKDATNREFEVVEIKRHALYNPKTMQNDIALLKLSRKVSRSAVCLPHESSLGGMEAVMLGWRGSFSESKIEEKLKILSPEECSKGGILCTEPRTEDVMCNVDSGAPLIIKHKERYEVIGLLTWNRNDCNFPALFTQVSHFKGWIENHSSF